MEGALGRFPKFALAEAARATAAVAEAAARRPTTHVVKLGGKRHSKKRDADAIGFHYDQPIAFYKSFLDSRMVYSCGYWDDGVHDARRRADREDRSHPAAKCGSSPASAARHRLRLGRARDPRGAAIRRARARRHAEQAPARRSEPPHRRSRRRRSRARRTARLSRSARRDVRQDHQRRHVRARRPRAARPVFHAPHTTRSTTAACSSITASRSRAATARAIA